MHPNFMPKRPFADIIPTIYAQFLSRLRAERLDYARCGDWWVRVSIINTWKAHSRDKIRVKISPSTFINSSAEREVTKGVRIKVTNLSHIPVSLKTAGFSFSEEGGLTPMLAQTRNDSERMEPRTSLTLTFPLESKEFENFLRLRSVFAETDCGNTFTLSPKELWAFVK